MRALTFPDEITKDLRTISDKKVKEEGLKILDWAYFQFLRATTRNQMDTISRQTRAKLGALCANMEELDYAHDFPRLDNAEGELHARCVLSHNWN